MEKRAFFTGRPSYLIGIDEKKENLEGNSLPFSSTFGKARETFPVGHDFMKFAGVKLEGLVVEDSELNDINLKLCLSKDYNDGISQSYFVVGEINLRLIEKLNQLIKKYPKSDKRK